MVEGECIHRGNLIPKTAISSQKAALRESNFKRYGRSRVYTQRKFDSQNGLLSQKAALRESNFKKIPKATELLKCFFRSLVAMPVQRMAKQPKEKLALTLRQTWVQNRHCKGKKLH